MKQYKPKEFSEMLNVSVKTLQRWDNQGVLPAYRNPKGRRYYTEERYKKYMGMQEEL
ncbi:helix-turn-helix domain-containing protein, partial [Bacillus mobilis]